MLGGSLRDLGQSWVCGSVSEVLGTEFVRKLLADDDPRTRVSAGADSTAIGPLLHPHNHRSCMYRTAHHANEHSFAIAIVA